MMDVDKPHSITGADDSESDNDMPHSDSFRSDNGVTDTEFEVEKLVMYCEGHGSGNREVGDKESASGSGKWEMLLNWNRLV